MFVLASLVAIESGCHDLSVLIRLGDAKGCYMGHAGIAIDNEYYDWGPSDDSRSDFMYYTFGDKGEPYEDIRKSSNPYRKNYATRADIRKDLSRKTNPCSSYEVKIKITAQEAFYIKYYWDFIYEEAPYFHILKNQCANVAFASLKYAGLFKKGRVILLPKTLLERSQRELLSTCGNEKGKAATTYKLK